MERLTSHARKVLTISAGSVLLVVGIALLVLPGPGIPLIIVGLGLLGAHFAWARKLRERAMAYARQAGHRVRDALSPERREPARPGPGRPDAKAEET